MSQALGGVLHFLSCRHPDSFTRCLLVRPYACTAAWPSHGALGDLEKVDATPQGSQVGMIEMPHNNRHFNSFHHPMQAALEGR